MTRQNVQEKRRKVIILGLDGATFDVLLPRVERGEMPNLAALLEQADLFAGADSGPAHLAAAVGTRTVVLFSGTNSPRQWRPWGEHVRVVRRPVDCSPCHRRTCPWREHPCMRGLRPGEVAEAIERLLVEAGRAASRAGEESRKGAKAQREEGRVG